MLLAGTFQEVAARAGATWAAPLHGCEQSAPLTPQIGPPQQGTADTLSKR